VTYSLHPGAEQDIADALDFYREQAGVLIAQRFLSEFERIAQLLVEHPDIGTPTSKGRRVFPLRVHTPSCIEALRPAFESLSCGTSTGSPATAGHERKPDQELNR
jgi:hypothetical protein